MNRIFLMPSPEKMSVKLSIEKTSNKVKPLKNEGSGLLRLLQLMYYLGFLPVEWMTNTNGSVTGFKICRVKSVFMITVDTLLALLIPAYFCLWHWLNVEDFDLARIWKISYYQQLNDGTVTTTLCQLLYVGFPSSIFWIYFKTGKLNDLE